jgi:hypothetical protein
MPLAREALVTRVDLPLSGVARLKDFSPDGAVVESYVNGEWVESKAVVPIEAYQPATLPEIVAARHSGRLPRARGLFSIDDEKLKRALQRPGLTEAEVDAIMMDPSQDRELKLLLLAYLTPRGYPTVL